MFLWGRRFRLPSPERSGSPPFAHARNAASSARQHHRSPTQWQAKPPAPQSFTRPRDPLCPAAPCPDAGRNPAPRRRHRRDNHHAERSDREGPRQRPDPGHRPHRPRRSEPQSHRREGCIRSARRIHRRPHPRRHARRIPLRRFGRRKAHHGNVPGRPLRQRPLSRPRRQLQVGLFFFAPNHRQRIRLPQSAISI